jgi:hypothetical protein
MADNERDQDQDIFDEDTNKDGEGFKITDTIKKLFAVGVGAAFMTEESIRGQLKELKLPKDLLNVLLQGAAKSKEELTSRVGKELIGIFSKIDFVSEASRFVENHKFRVSAEIEVLKKDGKSETPEAEVSVRIPKKEAE